MPAELALDGLADLTRLEVEGDLLELRDKAAADVRELAAVRSRAGVGGVLLGELGEVGTVLKLLIELVGLLLLVDQDVRDVAALGLGELVLVLVVVRVDFLVGHRLALRDLREELLRDELRAQIGQDVCLGDRLLLELRPVLRVVAVEELLLQLREPGVDFLIRHRDPESLRLSRELDPLDQEIDGLVLQLLVLGRAGGGKLPLLRLVGRLGLGEETVELGPGHGRLIDDRHGVRGNGDRARTLGVVTVVPAAAARRRERDHRAHEEQEKPAGGVHDSKENGTQAARRRIASTRSSAPSNCSTRLETSRRALV